jgi:hypothetical protein
MILTHARQLRFGKHGQKRLMRMTARLIAVGSWGKKPQKLNERRLSGSEAMILYGR